MVEEARLEDVGSGLAPVSPGWFVVSVGEAAWLHNDDFGGRCVFESSQRVLAERPELEPKMYEQLGFTLAVLEAGKPTGMYHAESRQEDGTIVYPVSEIAQPRGACVASETNTPREAYAPFAHWRLGRPGARSRL